MNKEGRLMVVVLVVIAVATRCTSGRFVVEKNSVTVLQPYSLKAKHDGSIANFGVPEYGGSMVGSVVYPDHNINACKSFDGVKPFKSHTSRPSFLLVDRGECYFALKAWNAQQAGAAAVLVADSIDEDLITMDSPEETSDADGFIDKLEVPSVLIEKDFGDSLKDELKKGNEVVVKLDWSEAMPNPDGRVEYELWTNSNDECGIRCKDQMDFIKDFKGHAQILEKEGYTLFTPHYITWYCPEPFLLSSQCKSQCINRGRYCAPDPEQDFGEGYEGKDVVFENLRQLCVHSVAKSENRSWVWWDYVTDFHIRCSMKEKKYTKTCAEDVLKSLNLPVDKIEKCMGNPEADADNEILKNEQDKQIGKGSRGDITILPTLVINDVQYRGKLERSAVLKAVCSAFKETTDPPICLSGGIETNECLENNGGCWQDTQANITACKDTFRGKVCECPLVAGVQYQGDGYTTCKAHGPGRCNINNGGCWSETRNGKTFSACSALDLSGCNCPEGFRGDGHKCDDIDECKEHAACQCSGCSCKNTWGGYDCKCGGNRLYMKDQDTCIERSSSKSGWFPTVLVLAVLAGFGSAGYIFYKYRLRSYMDSADLVKKYLGRVVPCDDNYYAALNSAVFSDGSFVYIPKGTRCPMQISTYFRINAFETGQFERTLIVADEGSFVEYLEGCTAPSYDTNQLHAAVVELYADDDAEIKYSTVQNWYAGDEEGKGGIYNFVTKRGLCSGQRSKISWTQVETGSAITWKYPSVVLEGDDSVGEFYSVALTNNYQQADTGTKMIHKGKNTRSRIISKGISAGNSRNVYRGLVQVQSKAYNARNSSQCDSMLIGDKAAANTYPYIQVKNPSARIEHEASTSKIGEDQLFYFQQRGIDYERAMAAMISGFCKDVFNELPDEFGAEVNQLMSIKLEGSVG